MPQRMPDMDAIGETVSESLEDPKGASPHADHVAIMARFLSVLS
jgi:hypothetical protein